MTERQTPLPALRPALVVVINTALGVPGVVSFFLVWVYLKNWPLARLGITAREPTEDDGPIGWFIVGGPIVVLSVLLWWLLGRTLRRLYGLQAWRWYWPVAAASAALPSVVLVALDILR